MIEILYCAWNRRTFTEVTLDALRENTDWSLVSRVVMYDDGSTDGTLGVLRAAAKDWPVEAVLRRREYRSPTTTMKEYIANARCQWFAKIDNDIMVCDGWLNAMLGVVERNHEIELLGMEVGHGGKPGDNPRYRFKPSDHIGGIGLMRRSAFTFRPPMRPDGRNGFTEFQHDYQPVRGWISPDLPCPLLDRMPMDPWRALSRRYRKQKWQRPWPCYDEQGEAWSWDWFTAVAL